MIVLLIYMEKEISGTAFSSLRRWRSERKNTEVILSHIKKSVTLLQTAQHSFTFDKNSTTNIPAKSGCGLMQKLSLVGMNKGTTSVHVNYTTGHNITNTGGNCMCRICATTQATLNHGIIQNDDSRTMSGLFPKQKRTIIQNWLCSR